MGDLVCFNVTQQNDFKSTPTARQFGLGRHLEIDDNTLAVQHKTRRQQKETVSNDHLIRVRRYENSAGKAQFVNRRPKNQPDGHEGRRLGCPHKKQEPRKKPTNTNNPHQTNPFRADLRAFCRLDGDGIIHQRSPAGLADKSLPVGVSGLVHGRLIT
jgi:hypothetical protein